MMKSAELGIDAVEKWQASTCPKCHGPILPQFAEGYPTGRMMCLKRFCPQLPYFPEVTK